MAPKRTYPPTMLHCQKVRFVAMLRHLLLKLASFFRSKRNLLDTLSFENGRSNLIWASFDA